MLSNADELVLNTVQLHGSVYISNIIIEQIVFLLLSSHSNNVTHAYSNITIGHECRHEEQSYFDSAILTYNFDKSKGQEEN